MTFYLFSSLGAIVAGFLVLTPSLIGQKQKLFAVSQIGHPTPGSDLQAQPFGPVKPTDKERTFSLTLRPKLEARLLCSSGRVIPATPEVDPKLLKRAPDDKKYTMRTVPAPPCVVPGSQQPTPAPQNTR